MPKQRPPQRTAPPGIKLHPPFRYYPLPMSQSTLTR